MFAKLRMSRIETSSLSWVHTARRHSVIESADSTDLGCANQPEGFDGLRLIGIKGVVRMGLSRAISRGMGQRCSLIEPCSV